jgi:hypothetical protein
VAFSARVRYIGFKNLGHRIIAAFYVMDTMAADTGSGMWISILIQSLSMMARLIQGELIGSEVIPFHSLGIGIASGTEFRDLFKGRVADKPVFQGMRRVFVKRGGISSVTIMACHLSFNVDAFLKQSDRLGIFSS